MAYTQARRLYGAQVDLQRFQQAQIYYALTSDYDTLAEYHSAYAGLQQALQTVAAETDLPDEQAALGALQTDLAAVRGHSDLVLAAVDDEDWDQVAELSDQPAARVDPILARMGTLIAARNATLVDLQSDVERFSTLAWLIVAVTAPLFLVMIAAMVLVFARQIHVPILHMADALDDVREGRFDRAALSSLPDRHDEIGYLAREYVRMAAAVLNRRSALEATATEIRAKIR